MTHPGFALQEARSIYQSLSMRMQLTLYLMLLESKIVVPLYSVVVSHGRGRVYLSMLCPSKRGLNLIRPL